LVSKTGRQILHRMIASIPWFYVAFKKQELWHTFDCTLF
jgi:hypothetical protein